MCPGVLKRTHTHTPFPTLSNLPFSPHGAPRGFLGRYLATLGSLTKALPLEAVLVPTKDMADVGRLAALNSGPRAGR